MRTKGMSYSQIQEVLGIGKGTLSPWLKDMPLSKDRMSELRENNPHRIASFRQTMQKKRLARLEVAHGRAHRDIRELTERDLYVLGLGLYWAEGTKSLRGKIEITNTDPWIMLTFLEWLEARGVGRQQLVVRLQLYADMDIEKETRFWMHRLKIPRSRFRKPHMKKSTLAGLSRKNGFGHGTCSVIFDNIAMWEYIMMALRVLRERHNRP